MHLTHLGSVQYTDVHRFSIVERALAHVQDIADSVSVRTSIQAHHYHTAWTDPGAVETKF